MDKEKIATTYKEYKSGTKQQVEGFGKLCCYQGLDYLEKLLENDKYYSEELEDNFIFIQSGINGIEQQAKKQKEAINKVIKIFEECKLLMPHEFDWGEQVDYVLDILKEVSE